MRALRTHLFIVDPLLGQSIVVHRRGPTTKNRLSRVLGGQSILPLLQLALLALLAENLQQTVEDVQGNAQRRTVRPVAHKGVHVVEGDGGRLRQKVVAHQQANQLGAVYLLQKKSNLIDLGERRGQHHPVGEQHLCDLPHQPGAGGGRRLVPLQVVHHQVPHAVADGERRVADEGALRHVRPVLVEDVQQVDVDAVDGGGGGGGGGRLLQQRGRGQRVNGVRAVGGGRSVALATGPAPAAHLCALKQGEDHVVVDAAVVVGAVQQLHVLRGHAAEDGLQRQAEEGAQAEGRFVETGVHAEGDRLLGGEQRGGNGVLLGVALQQPVTGADQLVLAPQRLLVDGRVRGRTYNAVLALQRGRGRLVSSRLSSLAAASILVHVGRAGLDQLQAVAGNQQRLRLLLQQLQLLVGGTSGAVVGSKTAGALESAPVVNELEWVVVVAIEGRLAVEKASWWWVVIKLARTPTPSAVEPHRRPRGPRLRLENPDKLLLQALVVEADQRGGIARLAEGQYKLAQADPPLLPVAVAHHRIVRLLDGAQLQVAGEEGTLQRAVVLLHLGVGLRAEGNEGDLHQLNDVVGGGVALEELNQLVVVAVDGAGVRLHVLLLFFLITIAVRSLCQQAIAACFRATALRLKASNLRRLASGLIFARKGLVVDAVQRLLQVANRLLPLAGHQRDDALEEGPREGLLHAPVQALIEPLQQVVLADAEEELRQLQLPLSERPEQLPHRGEVVGDDEAPNVAVSSTPAFTIIPSATATAGQDGAQVAAVLRRQLVRQQPPGEDAAAEGDEEVQHRALRIGVVEGGAVREDAQPVEVNVLAQLQHREELGVLDEG
ncbi:hypothetical protein TYRP_011876 [Tyrophagus putrescentiae]|nr:hypothetical protein TYRP_011876 [Tyrophagus putrescentiae]